MAPRHPMTSSTGIPRSGAASAISLEKMKRQWELAADSLPQLVLLLDVEGRLIRANRTVERWQIASVAQVKGLPLHEALHGKCSDPRCRLRTLWRSASMRVCNGEDASYKGWDAKLQRHLSITIKPASGGSRRVADLHAIATVDDVTLLESREKELAQALRQVQSESRRLAALHLDIREKERGRVARDLHDGLGQSLYLLKLSIQEATRHTQSGDPGTCADCLRRLARHVDDVVAELHRIAMDLRPSTLDDLGLLPTLTWFFREIQAPGKALRFVRDIQVAEGDVPEPLKITVYRILQEAVSNAVRHARARSVAVRLYKDDEGLHLTVADDGRGFTGKTRKGLGLQSMRERAEMHGGRYAIESVPGKGTRIAVSWPAAAHGSILAPASEAVGTDADDLNDTPLRRREDRPLDRSV